MTGAEELNLGTDFFPAERMVLRIALGIVRRGDDLPPNMVAVCIEAAARVAGVTQ